MKEILARFRDTQIFVLGDVMLDEYLWGSASRISPEAPVPVVQVRSESVRLGGAANVAANIRSLGGSVSVIGVVGEDAAAERLLHELDRAGVKGDGVVVERERPTTIKTRVVAGSQQVVRFDREEAGEISARCRKEIMIRLAERMPEMDALVISDYAKGVVGKSLLRAVLPLVVRQKKVVVVDPKVQNFFFYQGVTAITPNHHEVAALARRPLRDERDLVEVGEPLRRKIGAAALLVTRGEEGMSLFEAGGRVTHLPAMAHEVFDVTGAGDTVVAALTLALAAGARMREAALIANRAAGIVVEKMGTATVSLPELQHALRDGTRRGRG